MLKTDLRPTPLAGLLAQLGQTARAASRSGHAQLVWVSARVGPSDTEWALHPEGWVLRRPTAQAHLWAAGRAWSAEFSGPDRFSAAAEAWRGLAARTFADGPVPPVALVGFAFDGQAPQGPWSGFPQALVVVPRVLRVRLRRAEYLAVSCLVDPDGEDWERTVRTVETVAPQRGGSRPRAEVLRSWPAEEDWKAEVAAAEAACRSGALEKVVLARCVEVATEARPEAVLDTLAGRYPTCTSFAVSAGQAVFVGATPETLVRVRGERVWTQALAGTAPRGLDPQQDGTIRRRLLESPKEAREHDLVVSHLRQALGAVCADVRCGRRGVLLLPNVQHLRTRLSGRIQAPAGLLELAGRLHPTPAVAGLPVAAATEWIRGHESVPRGWYAGLVGWVDAAGGGAVVVAIRSALVREGRAWAFAGCGIVAGSDPQRELEESHLKLRPLMEALGVAGR